MEFSEVTKAIHAEIGGVLGQIVQAEADALLDVILAARRTYVTGEGRSGLVARTFAMRLQHLGLVSYVVGETICPALEAGDLLVAVSGSGKSGGTLVVAEGAKKAGATLAAVSATRDNPLAKMSDLVLPTSCGPSADQLLFLFVQSLTLRRSGPPRLFRHRRVSTRQPDQPGSPVTVDQRIQRVGAVGRRGGLSPSEDGGNIDTVDFN